MKLILFFAYVFFLAIYAVGPIILLLKRQADAAGGKKKLWKTYLALFGVGALSTAAAYGAYALLIVKKIGTALNLLMGLIPV